MAAGWEWGAGLWGGGGGCRVGVWSTSIIHIILQLHPLFPPSLPPMPFLPLSFIFTPSPDSNPAFRFCLPFILTLYPSPPSVFVLHSPPSPPPFSLLTCFSFFKFSMVIEHYSSFPNSIKNKLNFQLFSNYSFNFR